MRGGRQSGRLMCGPCEVRNAPKGSNGQFGVETMRTTMRTRRTGQRHEDWSHALFDPEIQQWHFVPFSGPSPDRSWDVPGTVKPC